MAVLKRDHLLACLAGMLSCYSPDVRDCVVTCASAADCAGGQVCGSDGFCAGAARAGHCAQAATPDGGMPLDAALPTDAHPDAPRDAAVDAGPTTVALVIHIDGGGTVFLVGGSSCDSSAPMHECTLVVLANVPVTLSAVPHDNQAFDHWTTTACAGQGSICVFTPVADTDVGVKFRKADH